MFPKKIKGSVGFFFSRKRKELQETPAIRGRHSDDILHARGDKVGSCKSTKPLNTNDVAELSPAIILPQEVLQALASPYRKSFMTPRRC